MTGERDERLIPGPVPETVPEWRMEQHPAHVPTGKADGVLFYGSKVQPLAALNTPRGHESAGVEVAASMEERALRYLRPMPKEWHLENRGRRGIAVPNVDRLIPRSIKAEAAAGGNRLIAMYTCDQHCIDAVQPEHANRWTYHRVEEGIWCVLYD